MAELKKYLDLESLGTLVGQIKAEDAKALKSAKDYADSLAGNYDAAGAAATAEGNAKAYTDELANGQVKANKEALETLNGSGEGSVAKAVADAKALIDADVDAVEATANKNKEDIAAINNAETGILAQAKGYADAEVAEVQGAVDALEDYVGTIPESATATNIVAYVQEKTSGIATSENLQELTNRVAQAETDIDNIEKDYLKAADKTELEGKVADAKSAAETAVAGEKSRAEGIEAGLRTDIDTVMGDYLKKADKDELQGNIDTVSGALERLTNGVSADEIDGVNDLIKYVKEHGPEVTTMQEGISDNAEAIEGVTGRVGTLEGKMTAAEGAIATKAEKSYVDEQVQALQGADTGLGNRITALENKFGGAEGSVEDMIADAKAEAIESATATASADATAKANAAEAAAKAHADAEVAKDRERLVALEAIDHDHSNKAELDLIASGDKAKWDEAYGKRHEHSNKTVLDGITSDLITKWNTVDSKAAKSDLDGAVARIAANEGAISTLQGTVADKAETSALEAAVARIAKNETDIAANTSAINSFTAITTAEVQALFA